MLTYIYCLPIWKICLFVIIASMIWRIIRKRAKQYRFWKAFVLVCTILMFFIICWTTIMSRETIPEGHVYSLIPFITYRNAQTNVELYRSSFMNCLLFYPLGLLLPEALPVKWNKKDRFKNTVIILLCLSMGIEAVQFLYHLGLAEIDDVIHNTIGATLGALVT